MLNFVYMLEFKENDKVYIGLSNDLNWDITIKNDLLELVYKLEISDIKILAYDMDERIAKIDYQMWLDKTASKNINSTFSDKIPNGMITLTLKDKKALRQELRRLDSKYISLFYEYKIMEENYLRLDEIIDSAISDSVSDWKEDEK